MCSSLNDLKSAYNTTQHSPMRSSLRALFKQNSWAIITVLTGAMLEYYSYMLLASMISKSEFISFFFGPNTPSAQLFKGTLFFFIAALSRPLGALIFGFIGDRYGRKQALFCALVTMALSCFLIAALPGYAHIGCIAIAALFIARVAQIMSASGETNGAPIFLIEHFGITRSCLASGLAYFGTMVGSALASFASSNFTNWRYAFLIGGLAGFVGLLIRINVLESDEFIQANQKTNQQDSNKTTSIKNTHKFHNISAYIIVGLISAACSGGFYFIYIGIPAICKQLGTHLALAELTTTGTLFYAITLLIVGFIADYTSLFNIMRAGILGFIFSASTLLFAICYYTQIDFVHYVSYFALVFSLGIFAAPSHSFMYRFFPPKSRYRAVSLSYSIATATIGAGTPYMVKILTACMNTALAALLWIAPVMLVAYAALDKASKIWKAKVEHNS